MNWESSQVSRTLNSEANESIPLSRKPKKLNTPIWFNLEISKLLNLRQKAWRVFKRNRIQQLAVKYRKACAKKSLQNFQEGHKSFLNLLNPSMDIRYLWSKIKNLRSNRANSFSTIFIDMDFISHPQQIANRFANYWSSLNSNKSFEAISKLIIYVQYINLIELNELFRTLKGSTPTIDKITYATIKNSPPEVKERLCNL